MATALSWAVSDADRGVTCVRRSRLERPDLATCRPIQCHRVLSGWVKPGGHRDSTGITATQGVFAAQSGIRHRQVDKPAPKDNEVLIAIHATTVSTADCNMRNFTFVTRSMLPFAKLMFGIGKPWKARVLGTELAGEVESAGKDVKRFKKGDRIVASTGMAGGGHAQYACVREDGAVALKSDSLNWEQAVAIPFGANTALYFLRDLGKIQAGQELLIIGASGSIGSAGVQLAKHFGAMVTARLQRCERRSGEVPGCGPRDRLHQGRFHARADTYDLIFDIVGATSFRRCRHDVEAPRYFSSEHHGPKRHGWNPVDVNSWRQEAERRRRHGQPGENERDRRTCRGREAQAGD